MFKEKDCSNCRQKEELFFHASTELPIEYCKRLRITINKYSFPEHCKYHSETFTDKIKRIIM